MRKTCRLIYATAALTFMLCLTGLVMSGEAQAQRFVDNGNGTVTDTVTNLMWTKDAHPFGRLNWHDAMSRCSSFSVSGIGGWRLPSRDELVALYHAMSGGHPFTGVQTSTYWTSMTFSTDAPYAWFVSLYNGHMKSCDKTSNYYVWPVRAGQ